jgi:DNA-binding NtrC family response regulator
VTRLGDRALGWLVRQPWPGNVRELENVVQRAVVLADAEVLDLDDLQDAAQLPKEAVPQSGESGGLRGHLERVSSDIEKKLIAQALVEEHDRRGPAAKRLGISRKHLYNKMKKYGLV